MVYTEYAWTAAVSRQQFHRAPAMQQPKSSVSTPLEDTFLKRSTTVYNHSFRITCDMSAVSLLKSTILKAINVCMIFVCHIKKIKNHAQNTTFSFYYFVVIHAVWNHVQTCTWEKNNFFFSLPTFVINLYELKRHTNMASKVFSFLLFVLFLLKFQF